MLPIIPGSVGAALPVCKVLSTPSTLAYPGGRGMGGNAAGPP